MSLNDRARGRSRGKDRDTIGAERSARKNLAEALLVERRHILLVSHMRSYSTLLGHLLASHPQVAGYAEQHRSYRSFDDLAGMCFGVWKTSDFVVTGDHLFDKLLHDQYVVADPVLHRDDVLPVYGIREPIASVRSIVATGRRKKRDRWSDAEGAAVHLTKRYAAVRAIADRRGDAAALFTDSIVTDTAPVLAALTAYLGLSSPISAEFGRFPKTGVAGFGDPIGPIEAGRIVSDRAVHDVEVPAELAARLVEDYRRTAEHLLATCSTVIGSPAATTDARTDAWSGDQSGE